MRISPRIPAAGVALTAFACFAPSAALADSGTIAFRVVKAGWVIGGSGGSGTLLFHGRRYPLAIGGISYGIVFGASETVFRGTVRNIRGPADVAGVYGAAGAGAAIGGGAQFIVLRNEKGAELALSGREGGVQSHGGPRRVAISFR